MVFQLNRFHNQGKMDTYVSFPELLDLKKMGVSSGNSAPLYNLYGVVNHTGNTEKGHYTANCKNLISNVLPNSGTIPLDHV